MNLDPTVSPWIGIFASTGVCLWIVAIGAPLARAVFGDRPRPVWPFYAPALGIVAVLLTTNLSAYVIPGAPSAWFGLLAPSAVAAAVAWRTGAFRRPARRTVLGLLALVTASAGVFVLAFANRTQVRHGDESWHLALAQRMARGAFPPVTPYGPDAGIGYHYGHNLLAASIINTAGVPPWTAMAVLMSFLIVALILVTVGFAWDIGTPLPLAWGAGATIGLFSGSVRIGLPPYVETPGQTGGLAGFIAGLAPAEAGVAFGWLQAPHWTLAVAIVVLVAAALEAGAARPQAAVVAVAAGVSALAEAAVLILSSAALGVVGVVRLAWLRGRERMALAVALMVAALLAALAGGPVSDALFARGGTAGGVRIAFEPDWAKLAPFDLTGLALVRVGIVPLLAISAIATYRQRSWGLGYLTAAGVLGLVEAIFLQSPIPGNDARILHLATAIAMFAALSGIGAFATGLRGWRRNLATLAVIFLAVLPTALPRAVSGVRLASEGIVVRQPATDGSGFPFVGQARFREELEKDWDFYAWLARSLPSEARLLTTHPGLGALAAGVASPTSGRDMQSLAPRVTPVYQDALRFLNGDDLADMGITHLHVTDRLAEALTPQARRLLDDPAHFRLLADLRSVSDRRHRVFEVMPGAGTREAAPSSYRLLREVVSPDAAVYLLGGLTGHQRRMLLFTFVEQEHLRAPGTLIERVTRFPRFEPVSEIPNEGVVALPEYVEPLMLGLSRGDAFWAGYGIRVYDLARAWSPVWRIGSDSVGLPKPLLSMCESVVDGELNVRLLGEPEDTVVAGLTAATMSGAPQVIDVPVRNCQTLAFASHAGVAPFAQVRPRRLVVHPQLAPHVAGLGLDGGVDGDMVIVNLWYRNPHRIPFSAGTEFRLYQVDSSGALPANPDPRASIRWWNGPLLLAADTQMARVEFDPQRLEINGIAGGGMAELVSGRTYLLTLNIAGTGTRSGFVEIQNQIPLARVVVGDANVPSEVLSGIVALEPRTVGEIGRWSSYVGSVGWDVDLTPWREQPETSPDMPRRKLALVLATVLLAIGASPASALSPSTSPTATPTADLSVTDPGLILVVVVIPVVLVALIWLGYIFWLIFHEGENVGSGSPEPRDNRGQRPPDRRQEPPERPGSVG